MGKLATPPKFGEKQAGATAKYLRIPPRKARLVLDVVRGKYVSDALAVLKFVPNFAAEAISDVIKSAVANAENSRPADPDSGRPMAPLVPDNLKLVRAWVDEGPRIKRLQPRAQGRAYRIVKRMCHISVIVEEVAPKPRPVRQQNASRRARSAAAPAATGRPATVTAPQKESTAPAAIEPEMTTAPVEASTVEQTTIVETVLPVEAAAPIVETAVAETVESATSAASNDSTDEIGAPVLTDADAAEAASDSGETSAEAPKAE